MVDEAELAGYEGGAPAVAVVEEPGEAVVWRRHRW